FAALGRRARAGHRVEDPRDLGAGEVRVDDEAGAFGEERLQAIGLHAVAGLGRAAVLPDDGAMDRAAGLAVPDERGLALVGDADAGELARVDPRRQQGVANGLERGADRKSTRLNSSHVKSSYAV